jgi:hypothetical protein
MRFLVRPRARAAFLIALTAVIAGSVAALAQSGSSGGNLGNDDKSLSGSREAPRSAEPERRSRRPVREEPRRASRGGGGAGANRFDGSWSYVAVGTTCQASVSGAGLIANGRAVGAGTTGGVSAGGAYHTVTVGSDGIVTTTNGHLSGNSGAGTFTRSDGCNGRWSSARQ